MTQDLGSFKPPEHNLLGVDIAGTVLDRAWAATSTTAAWTAGNAMSGRCPGDRQGGRPRVLRAPNGTSDALPRLAYDRLEIGIRGERHRSGRRRGGQQHTEIRLDREATVIGTAE